MPRPCLRASPSSGALEATLHEIMRPEGRKVAENAMDVFEREYGAKYPKAVASLRRDQAELLTFFDVPVAHWVYLRTGRVMASWWSEKAPGPLETSPTAREPQVT